MNSFAPQHSFFLSITSFDYKHENVKNVLVQSDTRTRRKHISPPRYSVCLYFYLLFYFIFQPFPTNTTQLYLTYMLLARAQHTHVGRWSHAIIDHRREKSTPCCALLSTFHIYSLAAVYMMLHLFST